MGACAERTHDMKTHCLWIRHAPIAQTGCYTGQRDVDAILPPALSGRVFPPDVVWFSSPLKRAVQTAQWLQPTRPLQYVDALKEQHFGQWEGCRYEEVWQEAEHRYDWSNPAGVRPEEGENFIDVCARVDAWLEQALVAHAGKTLVIVAHAGVIRAGLRHALALEPAQALSFPIHYTSLTHITYHPEEKRAYVEGAIGKDL